MLCLLPLLPKGTFWIQVSLVSVFACWVLQACLRIFSALSFHKMKSRHKENRTELKLLTISWGVFQLIWWVLSSQMICTSLGLIIARFCFHYKHLTFQSREGCSSNSVKLVLEMNLFKHRWGQVPPFIPFSVSSSHLLQVQTTQFLQNFNISPLHSKVLNKLLMFQEMSFPMKDTSQQLNSWNPLTANQPGLGVSMCWATQLESVYSLAEQMSSSPGSCKRTARDCAEVSVRLSSMGKKIYKYKYAEIGECLTQG